jgi:hypothetical protein
MLRNPAAHHSKRRHAILTSEKPGDFYRNWAARLQLRLTIQTVRTILSKLIVDAGDPRFSRFRKLKKVNDT